MSDHQGYTNTSTTSDNFDRTNFSIQFPMQLLTLMQDLPAGCRNTVQGCANNDMAIIVNLFRDDSSIFLKFSVNAEHYEHFPWIYMENSLHFTLTAVKADPLKKTWQKNKQRDNLSVLPKNSSADNEMRVGCSQHEQKPSHLVVGKVLNTFESDLADYAELSDECEADPTQSTVSENNKSNPEDAATVKNELRTTRRKCPASHLNSLVKESKRAKEKTLERYQHKCRLCTRQFLIQSTLKHHVSKKHHIYWETYLQSVKNDSLISSELCAKNTSQTGNPPESNCSSVTEVDREIPGTDCDDSDRITADIPVQSVILESGSEHKSDGSIKEPGVKITTKSRRRKTFKDVDNIDTSKEVFLCPGCYSEFPIFSFMYQHCIEAHKLDKTAEEYERLMKQVELEKISKSKNVSGFSIHCPVCSMSFPGQRVMRHMKMTHLTHPDFAQLFEGVHKEFLKMRAEHHSKNKRARENNAKQGQCPHCGLQAKRNILGNHIRYRCLKNKNRRDLFCCTKCGFMSVFKEKYEAHVKTAHIKTDAKNFVCDICSFSFLTKHGFLQHQQRKHGTLNSLNKPVTRHACKVCEKQFYTITHLHRHMSVHTGESPYQCDICQRSYKAKSNLASHQRTQHLKQYRCPCPHCGMGLDKKSLLQAHLKKCAVALASESTAKPASSANTDDIVVAPMDDSTEGTLIQIPDVSTSEGQDIYMVIPPEDYLQTELTEERSGMEQVMSFLLDSTNSSIVLDNLPDNMLVVKSTEAPL